jgi:hypothetical protein
VCVKQWCSLRETIINHHHHHVGLQAIFQIASGPFPALYIGGCYPGTEYVRFSMTVLPLFDVMSKIVGHGRRVTLPRYRTLEIQNLVEY